MVGNAMQLLLAAVECSQVLASADLDILIGWKYS